MAAHSDNSGPGVASKEGTAFESKGPKEPLDLVVVAFRTVMVQEPRRESLQRVFVQLATSHCQVASPENFAVDRLDIYSNVGR